MRLSVCLPMFFGNIPVPDAIRKAAALGYDAVEIWQYKNPDVEGVIKACKETGVEFAAMCTSYFTMTDAACHNAYLDGLRESAALAQKMGVKKLISQVGADTGAPRAEQHANIVKVLKAARPILEEFGVTLVIEPLNTIVDHRGYYLWSSAEAFDIVREVDHPLVKVLFDIYHQQVMEGNLIANITENLDLIGHLHSAGCPGRNELDNGELDYKKIFDAVDRAGYTGVCALEYRPILPAEESLKHTRELYK